MNARLLTYLSFLTCVLALNINTFLPRTIRKWSTCENDNEFFPHPINCNKFIQCFHKYPVEMKCPTGLHWSVSDNRCDYPWIANCNILGGILNKMLTVCENVSDNQNIVLSNPENCYTFFQCTHQKPQLMYCPEGLHWSVSKMRCEEPWLAKCNLFNSQLNVLSPETRCAEVPDYIDVLLPNPGDCGSYIQCVHQKPMVRPCPTGLHWSVTYNRCEWPSVANCKAENMCENVPETIDVLFPNPDDCETYFQCVHQKPFLRHCPTGLHWSSTNNRCDWPSVANCTTVINP